MATARASNRHLLNTKQHLSHKDLVWEHYLVWHRRLKFLLWFVLNLLLMSHSLIPGSLQCSTILSKWLLLKLLEGDRALECGAVINNSLWFGLFIWTSMVLSNCCCKWRRALQLLTGELLWIICTAVCKLGTLCWWRIWVQLHIPSWTLVEDDTLQFTVFLMRHLGGLLRCRRLTLTDMVLPTRRRTKVWNGLLFVLGWHPIATMLKEPQLRAYVRGAIPRYWAR